jgi:glucose/arabinose dehydrogenase
MRERRIHQQPREGATCMRVPRRLALSLSVNGALLLVCALSHAASVPNGFSDSTFEDGLSRPTAMTFAPDGRLFVSEQQGKLRIIKNGVLLSAPFVTLAVDANIERGLLGIAFDPSFSSNKFVYVYHTVPGSPARNRITRFAANGDVALGGSAKTIFDLTPLGANKHHNGGAIHFGKDGKLYVPVGDNGASASAQLLTTQMGKLLRINKDGTIPSDNPTSFSGISGTTSGANRAIWAAGLRNPFTSSVQPGTGKIFINDVGGTRGRR